MIGLKRPLAFFCASFVLTLALILAISFFCAAASAVVAVAAFFWLKRKNPEKANACLSALCAIALAVVCWGVQQMRMKSIHDQLSLTTRTVTARVTDIDAYDSWLLVSARVTAVSESDAKGFEITFFTREKLAQGDGFTALMTFDRGQNPYSSAVSMQAEANRILKIRKRQYPVFAAVSDIREYQTVSIRRWLPYEEGSIAAAVVTGEKSQLDPSLKIAFSRAGISHVLVVSGLHISLLTGLIMKLLNRAKAKPLIRLLILLALVAFCLTYYGLHPSVIRACVMCLFSYSAPVFLRRSDPVTSMSAAAFVILAVSPSFIMDLSFLLSFGCCFALTVAFPVVESAIDRKVPAQGWWRRSLKALLKSLAVTATISAVTFPLLVLFGVPISIVAPLCNIPIIAILPFLFVGSMMTMIPVEFISALAGLVAGLSAKLIALIARFFASFSFASVSTGYGWLKILLVYLAIVLVIIMVQKEKKARGTLIGFCVTAVVLIGILSRAYFVTGDPAVFLLKDQAILLSDGKSAALIVYDLDKNDAAYLKADLKSLHAENLQAIYLTGNLRDAAEKELIRLFPKTEIVAMKPGNSAAIRRVEPPYMFDVGRFRIQLEPEQYWIGYGGKILVFSFSDLKANTPYDCMLMLSSNETTAEPNILLRNQSDFERELPAQGMIAIFFKPDGQMKAVVEN